MCNWNGGVLSRTTATLFTRRERGPEALLKMDLVAMGRSADRFKMIVLDLMLAPCS